MHLVSIKHLSLKAIMASAISVLLANAASAQDWGKYQIEDRRSGYTYMTDETRLIQDDDFENPAMLWVEKGEELWETPAGKENKACANCHNEAANSMQTVGSRYPVFAKELGKLINIEQRINQCRTDRMKAEPFKWESEELLSMTSFVRNQSRGQAVAPVVDETTKPFFDKGKAFYEQRRGQLDLACMHCHQFYAGRSTSRERAQSRPVQRLSNLSAEVAKSWFVASAVPRLQ